MKQTAVEWLQEQYYDSEGKLTKQYFEQAKEMEEQQQDNFAIEFANWVLNQPFAIIIDKEILEIFKNKQVK